MTDSHPIEEYTIVERKFEGNVLLSVTTDGWSYVALRVDPGEWWCEYCSHEGDEFVNVFEKEFETVTGVGSAGNVRSREDAVLWLLDQAGLTSSDVRPIDPIT